MSVPFAYHIRSLFRRRGATLLTIAAIAFSVSVLVLVLALAEGFRASIRDTGRPDNLIVMRKGANSEGESGMAREKFRRLRAFQGIAKGKDTGLASPELYAAVNLRKAGGGTTNIPFRGVTKQGREVESTAKLAEGRWYEGANEVCVGKGLLERVEGCRLGGAIEFNGKDWSVVGVIDAPGQAFHSEIWADTEVLVEEFLRGGYNTTVVRAAEGSDIEELQKRIADDKTLQCKAIPQDRYFREQTSGLGDTLQTVAWFLAIVMAIGAAFGATNTLLASLQGRQREIGNLLAIGFRPLAIWFGFLTEALILGLIGGVLGVLIALPVNGIATGTTNWQTFTEQAFAFRVSPGVMVTAVIFGSFVGVIGGTLPAWRASRMKPTDALRAL